MSNNKPRVSIGMPVYNGEKSPYKNSGAYNFGDKNFDASEYEKAYEY